MIISPKKIIQDEVIICNNPEEQIQQNWVDLTIWRISKIIEGQNILTKTRRNHTDRIPLNFNEDDLIELSPWHYDIEYWEIFNIPNWVSASVYTRSTLNRGWNYLTSWYFDAGFSWTWWVCLHVTQWTLVLEKWVRIWQMVFSESEEWDIYNWVYNKKTTV